MLAKHNLPRVLAQTKDLPRVLDVGGAYGPLNIATHILDILGFDQRRDPLIAGQPVRFSKSTWTQAISAAVRGHLLTDISTTRFAAIRSRTSAIRSGSAAN